MTEGKPRIFLCHASEDKPRVRELYAQLKAAGYHPWLDEEDLLPGQKWRTEIKKIITDAYNLVVVCLSNSSVTKRGTVQREIKWALDILEEMPEDTIFLIPARLEHCQAPEGLSDLHWVNLFEAGGFERLKRALDFELAKREEGVKAEGVKQTPEVEVSGRQPPRHLFEPELIHIPAGEFLMGSDPDKDKTAQDDEQPKHRLFLPNYYVAKTPVTNAQYLAFVEATGHAEPDYWKGGKPPEDKEDHPVVRVTWHDAMAYCRWLAEAIGKAYRLPSEAEWEKAARGADGRTYPWGDEWDPGRCNSREGGRRDTTPVGQYSPRGDSPYGCVDMAGNVWEWCRSLYEPYPYDPNDGREDLEASGDRALRGGSWNFNPRFARVSSRLSTRPDYFYYNIGFRVYVSAQ